MRDTQIVSDEEAKKVFLDVLKSSDVIRIIDEMTTLVGITPDRKTFLIIVDEEIYKMVKRPTINITVTTIFPMAIFLTLNVDKKSISLVFLPKQFHLLTPLADNQIIGFIPRIYDEERMKEDLEFVKFPKGLVNTILPMIVVQRMFFPDPEDIHERVLRFLEKHFPRADWLVDYYTRAAQMSPS